MVDEEEHIWPQAGTDNPVQSLGLLEVDLENFGGEGAQTKFIEISTEKLQKMVEPLTLLSMALSSMIIRRDQIRIIVP